MTQPAAAPIPRDRFVAFAFAGSDLLVETDPGGTIAFAAGAFRVRLGQPPEHFIGCRATDLIAPSDQTKLSLALASAARRGRIAPMVLRLNDSRHSLATVSAMFLAGPPPRLCLTLGPVPLAAAEPDSQPSPRGFVRALESRLRVSGGGELSLLEVTGWQSVREALPAAEQRALRAEIQAAVAEAHPDGLAGEVAEGRFGVLVPGTADFAGVVKKLDALLKANPAARGAKVDGARLPLAAADVSPAQAARALRYAITQFASGGVAGARAAGSEAGLEGMIAAAELRARDLRAVIAERRFRLNFQPVVGLGDRAIHHYEALLRPLPAIGGSLPQTTQDFVVFAEAVGLTEDLDCAVADLALAAVQASPASSVAVNVSGLSIQSSGFIERFTSLLGGAAAPPAPGQMLVELTETAEIDDLAAAASNIAALRAAGVPVCLDDFGAGAAGFAYLREFGVDYVKIDGLYVQRAPTGARERGFVASMVELATAAGAKVVAEMIETEEQARLMQDLGTQFGQGWLFGRPGLLPGTQR